MIIIWPCIVLLLVRCIIALHELVNNKIQNKRLEEEEEAKAEEKKDEEKKDETKEGEKDKEKEAEAPLGGDAIKKDGAPCCFSR